MCESFNTSQAFSTLYIYMTYMFMTDLHVHDESKTITCFRYVIYCVS